MLLLGRVSYMNLILSLLKNEFHAWWCRCATDDLNNSSRSGCGFMHVNVLNSMSLMHNTFYMSRASIASNDPDQSLLLSRCLNTDDFRCGLWRFVHTDHLLGSRVLLYANDRTCGFQTDFMNSRSALVSGG